MISLKQQYYDWNKIACGSINEKLAKRVVTYCTVYENNSWPEWPVKIKVGFNGCFSTSYANIREAWLDFYKNEKNDKPWQGKVAEDIEWIIEMLESIPD